MTDHDDTESNVFTLPTGDISWAELPDEPPVPDHDANPGPIPGETAPEPESPQSVIDRVRAKARRGEKPPKGEVPKVRSGALVKPLRELYTSVGVVLTPFDPMCGQSVLENADACAKSLDALAQSNPAVRRALLALTSTSAWGGVLIAHLPLLLMVATHHGPDPVKEHTASLALMLNPNAMQHFPQPGGEATA